MQARADRAYSLRSILLFERRDVFLLFIRCFITGGGGLIKYTVLIKYTGVIKYTARKPILSVEICEIKYTVFVYIFRTKNFLQHFLHKK